MGNGTLFGLVAGDRKTQNVYLPRSDMWRDRSSNNGQQYTALGGLTIGMQAPSSLADGKSVTASGYIAANQALEMLRDGLDSTKWCATLATNGGSSV
ncbi:hypothetical protein [Arthrobacter sp. HY1533]|uniref:hypothetical protein n=1 Tax=Arthrobacter sp. HY1533 TaxID=2970919 RepID=UPI0022B9D4B2|nr:hypothetical protein [Arthrobacter sp. HY1533]